MAIKAGAFINNIRVSLTGNMNFTLSISEVEGDFRHEDAMAFSSELDISATAAELNQAIADFVKAWTATEWGTTWTPVVDTVKLFMGVDALAIP